MRVEHVYLGTWTQRTNLHLSEVYQFLKYGKGSEGLPAAKTAAARKALGAGEVVFQDLAINVVRTRCGDFDLSFTEDGVVLVASSGGDLKAASAALERFQETALRPAMRHLFSRGAPMPREVVDVDRSGDLVVVVRGASEDDVRAAFAAFDDRYHTHSSSQGIRVLTGHKLELIDLGDTPLDADDTETFVRDLVFFHEFERQLYAYVLLHRRIWDRITAIREARTLKYADFPGVRADILGFEKMLVIIKARLAQMEDMLGARRDGVDKTVGRVLAGLGMLDFASLHASRSYVSHLWDMTDEYAGGTLKLLETLYQENTQRELNALKFITLITALTSFFGMNIAFPWEAEWTRGATSSVGVLALIVVVAFSVYHLLRALILNRHFVLKEGRREP